MGANQSKSVDINLSDEDILFLTSHTKYTEQDIREWYKGFQKDCPDGKLTKQKFIEIYQLFFSNGSVEHFCEHVYRTFDSDQDGFIDFKEFLLAVGVTTGNDPIEKLKWAFKMYDINNDGFVDFQEMTKIIKCLYDMLGSNTELNENIKKVQSVFNKLDNNKDGNVSLDEFINVCTQDSQLSNLLCFKSESNCNLQTQN